MSFIVYFKGIVTEKSQCQEVMNIPSGSHNVPTDISKIVVTYTNGSEAPIYSIDFLRNNPDPVVYTVHVGVINNSDHQYCLKTVPYDVVPVTTVRGHYVNFSIRTDQYIIAYFSS